MSFLYLLILLGIFCIIIFVNALVCLIKNILNNNSTYKNTFILCITSVYLWICLIIFTTM
ncbi:hypothetical protein DW280_18285 [Clostridium botulinum]|nr:hypothetical protein [Clostridium botulinum]